MFQYYEGHRVISKRMVTLVKNDEGDFRECNIAVLYHIQKYHGRHSHNLVNIQLSSNI